MRRISVFIFICILPVMVQAQTEFGLRAGINVSDIVMTNYVNPDVESDLRLKTGLHAGFFVRGGWKERLGLAAELLYSNKGVKGNTPIHLHYVNLPVMAQYELGERIHLEVGPELGYLVTAGAEGGTYNNKLDLGLNAGIRFDLSRWSVYLRYGAGLFSVRQPDPVVGPGGPEKIRYQNRVLQLSMGYRLFRWEE